jgi:hypothetical protein
VAVVEQEMVPELLGAQVAEEVVDNLETSKVQVVLQIPVVVGVVLEW